MAPIYAAAVGISPQIIDDVRLRQLRSSLLEIELQVPLYRSNSSKDAVVVPLDIEYLVTLLEPWQTWFSEEQVSRSLPSTLTAIDLFDNSLTRAVRNCYFQVDLQEWIQPLNKIDACVSYYIQKYPSLLLIGPVKRTKSRGAVKAPDQLISKPAESLDEVNSVPGTVRKHICILVQFLAGMLMNASNKSIFNSVEELVDLLAAADDMIAAVALEALCNLATPPALHKQQAPEVQTHSTALHNSRTTSHKRLIALARGWGTRGSGLGLYTCSTADDSEFGQGALPKEAGELNFAFFRSLSEDKKVPKKKDDDVEVEEVDDSYLVRITLHAKDIVDDSGMAIESLKTSDESDESNKQKRRRVAPVTLGEQCIRSSAELFFMCLEKAGGRVHIPDDRLFPLLADIRLTRSFHCRATRIFAIERRLRALITILHSHPSQDIMSGYFQAQPELCVELIDLLRPTVSSAAVSAASSNTNSQGYSSLKQDAIAALANSPNIPYGVRKLALESLTALVARRDGTSGALTGVARHSNVLSELGVGKGQYLGLLPTLIRYSLASLGSFMPARERTEPQPVASERTSEDAIVIEVGLAFVEATMPPPLPRVLQLERALEFIDSVLTLTSAVVSTPPGTSALTDCGLIPALLTTVAIGNKELVNEVVSESSSSAPEVLRIKALLRFVTAQAVQILEGAIVTHNNALSAFHDLQGVEVLTTRLSKEILESRKKGEDKIESESDDAPMDCDPSDSDAAAKMDVDLSSSTSSNQLQSSQRVLLFSIVTCLTVVFHQESTSSSVAAPSGAAQLRKPELTEALIEIMDRVEAYGGHLASLIATLMSDVMNSDPHVVRHVHESGLANSFLKMLLVGPDETPVLPPVPELIMAVPNVLSALALTEDGANAIKDANPFPALLRLFYHPKYAMPNSRCLLNEMTAIVGTGLDEIMRHVQSLRPLICEGIAEAMNKVVAFGEELSLKESQLEIEPSETDRAASDLENERSCLMQYALNFGQVLEQILHNEEHCDPFVSAGGLDALVKLYPYLMPTGSEFLAHVSSLSCPSVSTLTHSTTEDSLTLAFKCIALRYDSFKLLQNMINTVNFHLTKLEECQSAMRDAFPSEKHSPSAGLDATYILEGLPREQIYSISNKSFLSSSKAVSNYLRQVVMVQWVTSLLSSVIKAACQRSQETGTGWSRTEREWKKELSSNAFEDLVGRLSRFHQSAIYEVCRIRTEEGFEERDKKRLGGCKPPKLRYRLRIVCTEGAVVRDGIEIDSCASIGSMEMGEIVDAFDRCVNSSGVLRYRTHRGWVSEQTRGHGREPIAEVLSLWETNDEEMEGLAEMNLKGRVEAGVPDICSTAANVLARVQTSYAELFSSLTRVVIQGVRSLPVRNVSFQQGNIAAHVATIMKTLSSEIMNGFNRTEIVAALKSSDFLSSPSMNESGFAMYLGCLLGHLHSCLFEEKRERRTVNVPLLIVLLNSHQANNSGDSNKSIEARISVFDAIDFIFKQGLVDFKSRATMDSSDKDKNQSNLPRQRLSRTIAACLPTATSILRRLLSGPSIISSPVSSVLSRVKQSDLSMLLGETNLSESSEQTPSSEEDTFSPEQFSRSLLCNVSETVMKTWVDQRFIYAPPHIAHPIATLVAEIIGGLEEATKKVASTPPSRRSELWNPFRGLVSGNRASESAASSNGEEEFEPSEEAISRLMEMGFSRDHSWDAIDSTGSNRLEIAMEYALSHPPPSPSAIRVRRAEIEQRREERRRQQEQQDAAASSSRDAGEDPAPAREEGGNPDGSQERPSGNGSEAMKVEVNQEPANMDEEKPNQDETITQAKSCLASWKTEATKISCDILAGGISEDAETSYIEQLHSDDGKGEGDSEVEALTVVLCSFLLDLCQRYPDERDIIATELLTRLKAQITETKNGESVKCKVKPGREASFSALCHGAVLFTRALPKTRTLVLKEGLVHHIISCIHDFLKSSQDPENNEQDSSKQKWPMWLAPSLLLLDIMAQPVVAFSENEKDIDEGLGETEITNGKGEFVQVKDEHKSQAATLSSLAHDLFTALYKARSVSEKALSEGADPKTTNQADQHAEKEEPPETSKTPDEDFVFKSVPAYFPLLPSDSVEACVEICLTLLGERSSSPPPPGVTHGTLLLLMRLLRTPKMSTHCLKSGAAEKILSLPRECRFTGHSGLVTLILRRLLEDEHTLQTAMETEIRGMITKLHGKKENASSSDKDKPNVPRRAFVQAITPLLCRDPASLLKAVAVSVMIEKGKSDSSADAKVTLLSSVERSRNLKIVAEVLKTKHIPVRSPPNRRRSSSSKPKKESKTSPRSKTPTRSSKRGLTPKRSKKEKNESKDKHEDDPKLFSHHPATHVTSLLINHIIQKSSKSERGEAGAGSDDFDFAFTSSFLWVANKLEILADLVLAIPACATAIHKFRPPRGKERSGRPSSLAHPSHALHGCPSPPKTFVSFLLHKLLAQDRWSSRKDQQVWHRRNVGEDDNPEDVKSKKKAAFRRTKVAQSTARLLVALVARPGEGRRRVIAELVFTLSGGQLGLSSASSFRPERPMLHTHASELHALQAWGELCIGLAAPRSNGSNYDGNSMLSFEVVKIMLETGMAHALLVAIHRVPLHHPMATNTVASLILPFEILSRPSVAEVVKTIVEKEAAVKEGKGGTKTPKRSPSSEIAQSQESTRRDSFADDHMLEDAFGMDAARSNNNAIDDSFADHQQGVLDEARHHDFGDNIDPHNEEDDDVEDEGRDMEIDDIGDEEGSDDEMSSSEESEESSDVDDSEDEDDDDSNDSDEDDEDGEADDGESVLDESEESQSGEEFEPDSDFNVDYREDMMVENQDYDGIEESGADRVETALDDGWTRIESSGFGGMLLGSRRGVAGAPFSGNVTARTRGFIDAAEAMIGTLLRTGEIHGDALAEIEGSLGIRIMAGGTTQRMSMDSANRGDGPLAEAFGSRRGGAGGGPPGDRSRRDVVGTLPHIHQRSQPDVGYSALGGGGRWNEISSMEYVYGGPSITAGSRNYDLISPIATPEDEDAVPTISQVDGQLFPGGPASAAHARTQHSLHPLLCGVDLPPVNALVSDLLPHGVRATRRGQMSTRRPGDWTNASFSNNGFLVSTSNGNIIRSNRSHNGTSLSLIGSPRSVFGPVGWTDDGLPFDATVEEFSSAFERALGESMVPPAQNLSSGDSNSNSGGAQQQDSDGAPASDGNPPNQGTDSQADAPMNDSAPAAAPNDEMSGESNREQGPTSESPTGQAQQETNDGDGVASSLATGLRLSPQSDASVENAPPQNQSASALDAPMQEAQTSEEAQVRSEERSPAMDVPPNSDAANAADHESPAPVATNEDQNVEDAGVNQEPNSNGLVCPPGMDPEVFDVLPIEMQQEVVEQARAASELAAQLDADSALDPEALAALPEDMRREVIEQEQQERRLREQAPADPANAEEMDNASFVASLAPELRQEILMTADDTFLASLPPDIRAEAQILRERASTNRRIFEETTGGNQDEVHNANNGGEANQRNTQGSGNREQNDAGAGASSSRRKQRAGKVRVETDRDDVVFLPPGGPIPLSSPVAKSDLKALLRFMYLLSPVRPHKLLQKVFQNLCTNPTLRHILSSTFVKLLHDDSKGALLTLDTLENDYGGPDEWRSIIDGLFSDALKDFPPPFLIGAAPEVLDTDGLNPNITLLRRKQTSDTAASIAANLPMSAKGSRHEQYLPPVVATRIVDTLQHMCKNSPRFCLDMLVNCVVEEIEMEDNRFTGFEKLLDLLEKPRYSKSSANLEQLLTMLESAVSPLSHLSKHGEDDVEISQKDIDAAALAGKEWVEVPRIVVSQERLQLLCSILRMETCRDTSFTKVNTIARRLCRIDANRGYVLAELASVARALGADAIRDLKALSIRMTSAVEQNQEHLAKRGEPDDAAASGSRKHFMISGSASSSVAVSTSTSELKLLRVLQTLQALCADTSDDSSSKKNEGSVIVTAELVQLLQAMNLNDLWAELTACLKVVQVLEGVNIEEDAETKVDDTDTNEADDENQPSGKKLQNSVAGLLTRFLPSIEAFFVANASSTRNSEKTNNGDEKSNASTSEKSPEGDAEDSGLNNLVGGTNLIEFVSANKVLLNALIRNNAGLLDKGLRALIQVPRCRHLLDFDVKRHWFKTQVRRLRQHASRRHGSLRLHIRRKHVFEDAYHQLRLRNADEMRGRLHITFRNEEGVDAGGLSREFFGILAKEIFNPNYALFTSTEDGSTFQPNQNSSINPDHLSYFRFVGRIVGKAVSDGYLLDAHFTRSLYKHMLGIKPTHHDMEAIDPDYYKNLKTILEYDLEDIGLDLTFSIEDHSFGRSRILDLIPDGRHVQVTEQTKAKYVSLVCQHRMTTAISSQIKAYLDGFYELVSPDLIAIFTPRELELLISGLPDIDVHDLKQNTDYVGWKATDKQIQWFWNVLFSLSRNQKAAFLQFVTGSSKVPLAGFGELPGMRGVQKFSIHKASGSSGALMSAHTCFNSLDLPVYNSEEEMREKLLYAIAEGGGTFLLA